MLYQPITDPPIGATPLVDKSAPVKNVARPKESDKFSIRYKSVNSPVPEIADEDDLALDPALSGTSVIFREGEIHKLKDHGDLARLARSDLKERIIGAKVKLPTPNNLERDECEMPFFDDFEHELSRPPPPFDLFVNMCSGSPHRPVLSLDTIFPTDDMRKRFWEKGQGVQRPVVDVVVVPVDAAAQKPHRKLHAEKETLKVDGNAISDAHGTEKRGESQQTGMVDEPPQEVIQTTRPVEATRAEAGEMNAEEAQADGEATTNAGETQAEGEAETNTVEAQADGEATLTPDETVPSPVLQSGGDGEMAEVQPRMFGTPEQNKATGMKKSMEVDLFDTNGVFEAVAAAPQGGKKREKVNLFDVLDESLPSTTKKKRKKIQLFTEEELFGPPAPPPIPNPLASLFEPPPKSQESFQLPSLFDDTVAIPPPPPAPEPQDPSMTNW